jgi:hypothetical protein
VRHAPPQAFVASSAEIHTSGPLSTSFPRSLGTRRSPSSSALLATPRPCSPTCPSPAIGRNAYVLLINESLIDLLGRKGEDLQSKARGKGKVSIGTAQDKKIKKESTDRAKIRRKRSTNKKGIAGEEGRRGAGE